VIAALFEAHEFGFESGLRVALRHLDEFDLVAAPRNPQFHAPPGAARQEVAPQRGVLEIGGSSTRGGTCVAWV
jgi:hypothetical protein